MRLTLQTPLLAALAAALIATGASPADAATTTYKGRATNMDGDFRYGKVTVRIADGKVKRIEIQSVTTTGCGGFMSVVFSDGHEGSRIVKGSNRVRNGRFSFVHQPTTDVEDQTTTYRGRVSGGRVTGTFASGDLCVNEGRWTAKR